MQHNLHVNQAVQRLFPMCRTQLAKQALRDGMSLQRFLNCPVLVIQDPHEKNKQGENIWIVNKWCRQQTMHAPSFLNNVTSPESGPTCFNPTRRTLGPGRHFFPKSGALQWRWDLCPSWPVAPFVFFWEGFPFKLSQPKRMPLFFLWPLGI